MENLIVNSSMSVCSTLVPARVGAPIPISSWASHGASCADFLATTSGGLVPGKLVYVEGAGAPRAPLSVASGVVSGNKRLTMAAGTFSGVSVGNWFRNTGGSNTSCKDIDYHVIATDGSSYVEIFAGASGAMMVNESATYSLTFYQGASDVDHTVNGQTSQSDPFFEAMPSYAMEVAGLSAGHIYTALSGWYGAANGSKVAQMWEVTPADNGWGSGDAADGCMKDGSLRWFQTHRVHWDGISQVTMPGEDFGCLLKKGSNNTERMWWNLAQRAPSYRSIVDQTKLQQIRGKTICFGMYARPTTSCSARLYFFDGVIYTYGPYFNATSTFDWQELCVTIPTGAAECRIGLEVNGSIGDLTFATQPMCKFDAFIGAGGYVPYKGYMALAMHQHPMKYVSAVALGANLPSQPIRLSQETNGQIRGVRALYLDLEGRCSQEGSMFLMDGPQTFQPSCVLLSHKTISLIPFSGGLDIMTDGLTRYLGQGVLADNAGKVGNPMLNAGTLVGIAVSREDASGGTIYATPTIGDVPISALTVLATAPATAGVMFGGAGQTSFNAGAKLGFQVSSGGGVQPTTLQGTLSIQEADQPLHISCSGPQSIGLQPISSPQPYYVDELYLQVNNTGWYDVTIDIMGVEF